MTETVKASQEDPKKDSSQQPSSPKTKSKTVKQTPEGNERPKSTEKVEKPPTKVVVRRLPPTMTLETFLDQVAPLPPVDYMYFVKADSSLSPNSFARAYLHFVHVADLLIFTEKFDNYVFVDGKGNEYPAIVEYAPFQRIPKQRSSRKKDPRIGTIGNDPYYLEFIEVLKAEEIQRKSASKTNKQHFFETSTTGLVTPKVTSTPLLEFLKARRADKLKTKEDKLAERRKREVERRKARDDARTSGKHVKTSETDFDTSSPASHVKLPQPSSDRTPDLAEIQTRYLRCMIGLDTDTSGLEQVSCSACCTKNLHAPHKCQILRERMHLLLLHISNTKNFVQPCSEVNVASLDLHQSIQAPESLKSFSMNQPLATGTPTPLFSSPCMNSADPMASTPVISQTSVSISSEPHKSADLDSCMIVKTSLSASVSKIDGCCVEGGSRERSLVRSQEISGKSYKNGKLSGAEQKFPSRINRGRNPSGKKGTAVPIKSNSNHFLVSNSPSQSKQTYYPSPKRVKQVKKNKPNMKLRELFKMLECGALQVQCPSPSNCPIEQMITLEELEKQLMSHPKGKVSVSESQSSNSNFPSEEEKLQQTVSSHKASFQSFQKHKSHKKKFGFKEIHHERGTYSAPSNRCQCLLSRSDETRRPYVTFESDVPSPFPYLDSLACIKAKRAILPSQFVQSRCVSPTSMRIHSMRNSNYVLQQTKNSQLRGLVCGHQKSFYDIKNPLCSPFVYNNNYDVAQEYSFFHPMHKAEAFYSPVGWNFGKNLRPNSYSTLYPNRAILQSDIGDKSHKQSKFNHNYGSSHNLWGNRFNALW